MASNHLLSITSITDYFKDNIKQLKRGEIAYKDNHILKFQTDPNLDIVMGDVKPSMRSNPYNVIISLKDGCIADAQCSCPRGTLICHHIAALAIYTHYNLSSTDKSCSWSTRQSNSLSEVKTINQIYNSFTSPNINIPDLDYENFKETLTNLTVPVGFSWLFQPEPELVHQNILINIMFDNRCKELVKSKDFTELKNYIKIKNYLTNELIIKIANDTIGQSKNDL